MIVDPHLPRGERLACSDPPEGLHELPLGGFQPLIWPADPVVECRIVPYPLTLRCWPPATSVGPIRTRPEAAPRMRSPLLPFVLFSA